MAHQLRAAFFFPTELLFPRFKVNVMQPLMGVVGEKRQSDAVMTAALSVIQQIR